MANKKAAVLHGEIKDIILNYARQLALESFYPIGTIYFSANNVSPQNFFGGVWEAIPNDTFMVVGNGNSANNNITLNSNQIPTLTTGNESQGHTHGVGYRSDGDYYSDVCYVAHRQNGQNMAWIGCFDGGSRIMQGYQNAGNSGSNYLSNETSSHTHTYTNNNQQPINLSNSVKRITLYAWKRVA